MLAELHLIGIPANISHEKRAISVFLSLLAPDLCLFRLLLAGLLFTLFGFPFTRFFALLSLRLCSFDLLFLLFFLCLSFFFSSSFLLDAERLDDILSLHFRVLNDIIYALIVGSLRHAEFYGKTTALVLGSIHLGNSIASFLASSKFDEAKATIHVCRRIEWHTDVFNWTKFLESRCEVLLSQVKAQVTHDNFASLGPWSTLLLGLSLLFGRDFCFSNPRNFIFLAHHF